ncbi:hypothetical protein LTR22_023289 [Elasticomyces elasticus]|nr:hypothetical protein LTR22_023289 [Elasticomyces elasticus]
MGLGWFVAGKDAAIEKGCTRFIHCSNLWEQGQLKKGDDFVTRGWLRQDENHYAFEKAETLPKAVQDVAGFIICEPFLGWVNSNDPRMLIDPTVQVSHI